MIQKHYTVTIKTRPEYQPSHDEIVEAICAVVKTKTESGPKPKSSYKVEVNTDFSK